MAKAADGETRTKGNGQVAQAPAVAIAAPPLLAASLPEVSDESLLEPLYETIGNPADRAIPAEGDVPENRRHAPGRSHPDGYGQPDRPLSIAITRPAIAAPPSHRIASHRTDRTGRPAVQKTPASPDWGMPLLQFET